MNDQDELSVPTVATHVIASGALLGLLAFGGLRLQPMLLGMPSVPVGATLLATMLPIVTVVLLSLLERILPPAGPRKSLRTWLLHFEITVFFTFMVGFSVALAALVVGGVARLCGIELGLIDLRFASGGGVLALLAAAWVSAVVSDFFFYWYHRALHVIPVLWAHHKLHHMDPALDAITVARQNWIEVFMAAIAIVTPMMLLFKIDTLDVWSYGILSGIVATVFSTLLVIGHMNVRWGAGAASLLWCTPQIHRIHHSRLPEHRDKNFAFSLPLWDKIFGTYYAPARDEYPPTGVDGETEIRTFWECQTFTMKQWWRMFAAWRARRGLGSATPAG